MMQQNLHDQMLWIAVSTTFPASFQFFSESKQGILNLRLVAMVSTGAFDQNGISASGGPPAASADDFASDRTPPPSPRSPFQDPPLPPPIPPSPSPILILPIRFAYFYFDPSPLLRSRYSLLLIHRMPRSWKGGSLVLSNRDFRDTKSNSFIEYDIEEPEAKYPDVAISSMKGDTTIYGIVHRILKRGNTSVIEVATKVARRATTNRLSSKTRAAIGNIFHDDGKQQNAFDTKSGPLLSGIAYCAASCSMILLNKVVLSSYNFDAGISLMLYQNFICVMIIVALRFFGVVTTEKLTWKLVRVWIPVNLIFVGMLVTGMYSLKYINVAMVTILKNMTNILTAIGEIYLFRKSQSKKVWAALCLMIISAVCGGITDLSFDAVGYTWQILNCILTASYSLTLRRVMDTAKQSTRSGSLNEISMVLLNNSLSIPFAVLLIILFNEWEYVYKTEVIKIPMFWLVATTSGLLGLGISFTSVWFLHQTGPTTYSLVGSLNKIPISLAGILLFKVPVSVPNLFSILFGLFAGILFAKAKMS